MYESEIYKFFFSWFFKQRFTEARIYVIFLNFTSSERKI